MNPLFLLVRIYTCVKLRTRFFIRFASLAHFRVTTLTISFFIKIKYFKTYIPAFDLFIVIAYGSVNEMIFSFLFTMNFFLFAKINEVL